MGSLGYMVAEVSVLIGLLLQHLDVHFVSPVLVILSGGSPTLPDWQRMYETDI
jgi:hypothetical protein